MMQIPDAVGVYENEDGDLWIRFGAEIGRAHV